MEANQNYATPLDPLMTLREVAKAIGRSVREVWREIERGELPRPVAGRPARLFQSDVRGYLEKLRAKRDQEGKSQKENVL
jgi:predicted DNA-binding transcriptional regulator AlpA